MDLSLVLVLAIVAELLILKIIPPRRRLARFVCRSVFFVLQTVLIVALIGSPFRPTFRPKDLPREFWLQILTCAWWVLAARVLVGWLEGVNEYVPDAVFCCLFVLIAGAIIITSVGEDPPGRQGGKFWWLFGAQRRTP